MARLSGLQKDVLALYRSILREAVLKDRAASPSAPPVVELLSTPGGSAAYARDQFRREASSLRRSDFKAIEHKMRKGKKQLQLLRMPGVNLVGGASSGR